jgi:DNA-binding beta-propeller fold protein YncE/transcriptional regulator with XRE-family HTH domain
MTDKRFVMPDGGAIVRGRVSKGWTQHDLAERSRVAKRTIESAEKGRRMRVDTVRLIAEALSLPLAEIVLEAWSDTSLRAAPESATPPAAPGLRKRVPARVIWILAVSLAAGSILTLRESAGGNAEAPAQWNQPLVVAAIPLGRAPNRSVLAPFAGELYATSPDDNTVVVIDTHKHTITHVIPLNGTAPVPLAVTPDGAAVYVGMRQGGLAVIDAASKQVTTIDTGDAPVDDIAVTPGGRVYLALGHRGLGLLELTSRRIRIVSPAQCPKNLALSPDGRDLWVAYQCGGPGGSAGRDAIGRFDAATGTFVRAVTGFPQVGGPIAVSADGSLVWANAADACLAEWYTKAGCPQTPARLINVIDAATNQRSDAISFAGFDPGRLTASPDGSVLAVGGTEGLLFFDPRTRRRLGALPIPANSITFTRDGARAYASMPALRQIAVLDFVVRVAVAVSPDSGEENLSQSSERPLTVTIYAGDVDPSSIDPETVTLGGMAAERTSGGKAWASILWRPVTKGKQHANSLVMRFSRTALSRRTGDSELILEGMTAAGTRIRGAATVLVVP